MTRKQGSYLYAWNDPIGGALVASGLRFLDCIPALDDGRGILMLKHAHREAKRDRKSGLAYVASTNISRLAKEDIYSWGDFYWADCSSHCFPEISAEDLSSLSHFSVSASPLHTVRIKSLGNNLLVAAHDDGWYVRIYYTDWEPVKRIIQGKVPTISEEQTGILKSGATGLWIQDGRICVEEKTFRVDDVINRHI